MSSATSLLVVVAGFAPLFLALYRSTPRIEPVYAEVVDAPNRSSLALQSDAPVSRAATRVRPRTALQVAACLFTADVPWHSAEVAAARVNAGEVELSVLIEWLESFGETATVFALVAGMETEDLRAVLSGREELDVQSLRDLARLKGEL